MMSTKDFAECNAEATKSSTSTVENATVLKDTTLSKEPVPGAWLEKPTTSTLKPAALFPAKD
jgi:hypothetical protein